MNVRRCFPVPAVAEYLEKLVVQLVQILPQTTFVPAQMDSSCEAAEQSVMVIFQALSVGAFDWEIHNQVHFQIFSTSLYFALTFEITILAYKKKKR